MFKVVLWTITTVRGKMDETYEMDFSRKVLSGYFLVDAVDKTIHTE